MIRCNNCGWYNPDTATFCEMCEESLAGFPKVEMPSPLEEAEEKPILPEEAEAVEEVPAVEEKPLEPPKKAGSSSLSATIRLSDNGKESRKPTEKAVNKKAFAATVRDVSAFMEGNSSSECPKCKYPVFGSATTCPNCGTQLKSVADTPKPDLAAPKPVFVPPKSSPEQESVTPAPALKESAVGSAAITLKDPTDDVAPKFKQTVRDYPKSEQPSAAPQKVPKTTLKDLKATIREIPAELLDDAPETAVYRLIPVESPDPEVIVLIPGEMVSIGNRRYKFVKE